MKYRMNVKTTLEADNYRGILVALKGSSPFTSELSLETYLKGLRKRLYRTYGVFVQVANYEQIVTLLVEKGILKSA